MKERGMLFSAPMVRAILDGSKTQTRRVMKPVPQMVTDKQIVSWDGDAAALMRLLDQVGRSCPYGQTGDRIWVREAFRAHSQYDKKPPREINAGSCLLYEADNDMAKFPWAGKYRPPMFMPRWASRIDLEITGVRVERLQDIHSADALAEGIDNLSDEWHVDYGIPGVVRAQHPVRAYQLLWESINGAGSWDANPWCWVIEFKRVKP